MRLQHYESISSQSHTLGYVMESILKRSHTYTEGVHVPKTEVKVSEKWGRSTRYIHKQIATIYRIKLCCSAIQRYGVLKTVQTRLWYFVLYLRIE